MGYLEKINIFLEVVDIIVNIFRQQLIAYGIILEIYTIIGSCILLKKIVKYRVILFILL